MISRARLWTACTLFLALSSPVRGDLQFPQPTADVGQVRSGTPLSHTFRFTNAGPNPVEVTEVQGSCGCLKPRLSKRLLQPGEAAELRLDVHTLSQTPGVHHWRVRLTYRDGDRIGQASLELTADVVAELTVQPASLTIFTDSAAAHEIVVTDLRPKALNVVELRPSSSRLKARLAGTSMDSQGHAVRKIQIEAADDYPEGRHEETLDIVTDDATYRNLKVPVTIVKRSRQSVTAVPPEVQLTLAAEQQAASKIVLIRDGSGREVMIDQVTTDHPAVGCQWARGPGAMATVRLTVDRSRLADKTLQAAVQVRLSRPEPRTLTVPVTCEVP